MQALVETRFVVRDEESGQYAATIKLWELGSAVLAKLDLRRYAERHMLALMELTGESVHLSVLDGAEVVYVHKVDSPNPVRAYTQIGGRVPACCVATGKAQLAHAMPSLLAGLATSLKAHTERSLTDPKAFLKEMAQVRQQGYAVNRGEWREGVWGIAAPIFDARGTVIAGIGVSGPANRFPKNVIAAWAGQVIEVAAEVGLALAGNDGTRVLNRVQLR
jgi:DNA-binding IclR family transcriptional regulator